MSLTTIKVRHNMEMAHRLTSGGKCENIHGHSWWVELALTGPVDTNGMVLEFGEVKRLFRQYIDLGYDHCLLLNREDWLVNELLPGIRLFEGDPTTENIAKAIWKWSTATFVDVQSKVTVWETSVNCAEYGEVDRG